MCPPNVPIRARRRSGTPQPTMNVFISNAAMAVETGQAEVVVEPELPPAPEQDNIFQTGKPAKKKRQVSEKQKAHLDRIRAKALERKKEKASERDWAGEWNMLGKRMALKSEMPMTANV